MIRACWMTERWRWVFAVAALVVTVFGVLYVSLFLLVFAPFPKDLAEPTAGFLLGSLLVLVGSGLAPRHRFVTAVVLAGLGTLLGAWLLSFHVPGLVAGGLVAVAFVAWWFHPRRTARSTVSVGAAACAAFVAFAVLVYARHVDRPARPDPLPSELADALGPHASRLTTVYRYDLGGFIDHQWLWRLDARPEVVALVVSGLGLRRTDTVPQRFWRMPPHYWPRAMPVGAEAFQSPAFSADRRGPDGAHYFLLYDKAHGSAYVWFKSNF
jgi:hypothetical protein